MKSISKIIFAVFVLFIAITACSYSGNATAITEPTYRYRADEGFQDIRISGANYSIGKVVDTIDGHEFVIVAKGDGVGITQIIDDSDNKDSD